MFRKWACELGVKALPSRLVNPETGSIIGVKIISLLGLKEARCHRVCPAAEIIYQKEVMAMSEFLAQYAKQGGLFVKHEE